MSTTVKVSEQLLVETREQLVHLLDEYASLKATCDAEPTATNHMYLEVAINNVVRQIRWPEHSRLSCGGPTMCLICHHDVGVKHGFIPAPADERLAPKPDGEDVVFGLEYSRPQTRGEEMPEVRRWKLFRNNVSMLARRIRKYQRYALLDDLIHLCEEHGAYANMLREHEDLGGYASTETLREEMLREEMPEWVQRNIRIAQAAGGMEHGWYETISYLAAENTRLLTALEEKEQELAQRSKVFIDTANDLSEKIESLQSASVLQKEELEQAKAAALGIDDERFDEGFFLGIRYTEQNPEMAKEWKAAYVQTLRAKLPDLPKDFSLADILEP